MDIKELVARAAARGASDIHLVAGLPPKMRVDGALTELAEESLSAADCEELAGTLAGERAFERMGNIGELDFADTIAGERVRVNLFRQQGRVSAALRILSSRIPELSSLGLPAAVERFPACKKGIILVTGETGSGKSTTLAAILQRINETRPVHIITLEDPIEYIYQPRRAVVNQREIGTDTRSYADGLRAVLREDPDIILIGEMRDAETIGIALTAAETGHLVFATLHTNSAPDSVDRIVSAFPADQQPQIRMKLSTTLRGILSQQLVMRRGGRGRCAACECMINTPAIANLIREGKTPQMYTSMLAGTGAGSLTMDNCLIQLASDGSIERETAAEAANDAEYVRRKLLM
ncbi:type IV pilus twitching motility protein PilT [Lachnoclostridium sp. Marseille-P6806]|uniref:type IV pilus twitching motility protein PilT n=1 Tax=Lachnoclostridium sp. Marseille-P6806 TaxID=2364793 RepID=UPI0010325D73|nr:PilT/PilU family type 4a pilus ATPase [Lachnoclostridium sp. Marseille-P6806]